MRGRFDGFDGLTAGRLTFSARSDSGSARTPALLREAWWAGVPGGGLPRLRMAGGRLSCTHSMKRALLVLLLATSTVFSEPQLAPNAPKDNPVPAAGREQVDAFNRAIAPYVAKAKVTYPEAKKRYLAGLPPKHTFFLTTRLIDKDGKWEQAFIAVETIKDGLVTGVIWSDLTLVKTFKRGQRYTFAEADMLDWLISKPDGTEEGNVVGNFLDTYRP